MNLTKRKGNEFIKRFYREKNLSITKQILNRGILSCTQDKFKILTENKFRNYNKKS